MVKESSGCINLQQKKLKVMAEIAGIAKKGKNKHQQYSYIAVDDVLDAMQLISQAYIAGFLPIKPSVAYKKFTFNEAAFDFIAPR